MITGTLINIGAVICGGGAGLLLKGKLQKKLSQSIIRAIGLGVCVIGISGALEGDPMLLIVSLALGALCGELLNIDGGLNKFGGWLQNKMSRNADNSLFAEGFVAATLLFCVGAMTVVGAIESGLSVGNNFQDNHKILLTKSILDGVSAMVFASTFGFGVLFSVIVILVYQGGIEFFAGYLKDVLTAPLITQISAVGNVMILAIGLNMVLNAKIKAANLLPGLLFAAGYYILFF